MGRAPQGRLSPDSIASPLRSPLGPTQNRRARPQGTRPNSSAPGPSTGWQGHVPARVPAPDSLPRHAFPRDRPTADVLPCGRPESTPPLLPRGHRVPPHGRGPESLRDGPHAAALTLLTRLRPRPAREVRETLLPLRACQAEGVITSCLPSEETPPKLGCGRPHSGRRVTRGI